MIVLDTHAFVWWTAKPEKLSAVARRRIEGAKQFGVCAISLWEIAMLVERGRIEFDRDVGEWLDVALAQERVELLPLSAEVAVRSTRLGPEFHGDPADRLIVATAMTHKAPLVTKDERIRDFPEAHAVW